MSFQHAPVWLRVAFTVFRFLFATVAAGAAELSSEIVLRAGAFGSRPACGFGHDSQLERATGLGVGHDSQLERATGVRCRPQQ